MMNLWRNFARACPYCAFLVVGGVIGVCGLILREGLDRALPTDSPNAYAGTVAVSYAVCIVLAFFAHRRFTFTAHDGQRRSRGSLPRFFLIYILGLGVSSGASVLLRYGLQMDAWLGRLAPTVAFALAVVLASVLTFGLNAKWTFQVREPGESH